jgi:hypothetical protein
MWIVAPQLGALETLEKISILNDVYLCGTQWWLSSKLHAENKHADKYCDDR